MSAKRRDKLVRRARRKEKKRAAGRALADAMVADRLRKEMPE